LNPGGEIKQSSYGAQNDNKGKLADALYSAVGSIAAAGYGVVN
jgi:hypothetical protein